MYKILINFHASLDVMEDVDKNRLCRLLIDEIQIYEEKQENEQWIKSLSFKIPIIEGDMNIGLDKGTHVETVVLIEKK